MFEGRFPYSHSSECVVSWSNDRFLDSTLAKRIIVSDLYTKCGGRILINSPFNYVGNGPTTPLTLVTSRCK
ncbi:hypothetical protein WN55_06808 [Dufourea novaeangliae]|uniref:Uncharacterized protein n=1 Tax=Dufourea novaeangliae TaxID=178035 RepID=A0A154PR33_DUFNO|nr:hypothetical protein WN55_06808 [Dufourea novaeangliae]